MRKDSFPFFFFFMFMFILGVLPATLSISQGTTLYSYHPYVLPSQCLVAALTDTPTIQGTDCSYSTEYLWDNTSTIAAWYAYTLDASPSWFSIRNTLNLSPSQTWNFFEFETCAFDTEVSPQNVTIGYYDVGVGDWVNLGTWKNPSTACSSSASCFSSPVWGNISFSSSTFSRVRVDVAAKQCDQGGSTYARVDIGEYNFTYRNYTVNHFPVVNFSVTPIGCFNVSGSLSPVPTNISVSGYDYEGDTILYSLKTDVESDTYIGQFQYTNTFIKCDLSQTWVPDFLDRFILFLFPSIRDQCPQETTTSTHIPVQYEVRSGSCPISTSTNSTTFYLEQFQNAHGRDTWMLAMNPSCPLRHEALVRTSFLYGAAIYDFSLASQFYVYPVNQSRYNLTLYSTLSPETVLGAVLFYQNSSDELVVSSWGKDGVSEMTVLNLSAFQVLNFYPHLSFTLSFDYSGQNMTFRIAQGNTTPSQNYTWNTSAGQVRYFSMNTDDSDMWLWWEDFLVTSDTFSPVFSESVQGTIKAYTPGTKTATLAYTDSVNSPDFQVVTDTFEVDSCDRISLNFSSFGKETNLNESFQKGDIFSIGKIIIGKPWEDFLDSQSDFRRKHHMLLWGSFICMVIAMVFMGNQLKSAVLVGAISNAVICFLTSYWVGFITFLIIIAAAIAEDVVYIFYGGKGKGGENE